MHACRVTHGRTFVFIILFLCFVGSDKTPQKSEMVRSKGKYKSLKRFHKHHSEETLKAVNGESINVPLDQYRRLVKAQEVILNYVKHGLRSDEVVKGTRMHLLSKVQDDIPTSLPGSSL